ncbi:MAG TPA: hypothetical protein EYQ50_13275 [Verrucomicrobiales bacterium]|nr:hypothetical protein [Verrucomicrobiales bacterium]HIL69181.1 hypothetical protein [Verrucomicrobiota bacterium]
MKKESLIPKTWNIPQVLRNRLGSEVGRQRAMVAEGHILLILHLPPKPKDDGREGRFIWRSPDGNWVSNDLGSGPDTVKRHLNQYEKLILEFDEMEEVAGNATQYFSVLEGLAPLQRAARHLHQVLQEARKELPEATEIINFRDHAYNIERRAELTYNEAKNSLEFSIAKQAENQSKASHSMAVASHRLNILVAFFFPLATLSALFGVNIIHGMENLTPPAPFLIFLATGLSSGVILTLFVTRKS